MEYILTPPGARGWTLNYKRMQVSDARIACSTILLGIVGRPSSIGQQRAEHYHHVQAVDLQLNADEGGRIIKCLHVTYKNSRLAMVIPI